MLRPTALSVAALAAAAMLLESTLTRLLAVAQFYHFAFLVVSLALLGFGASGTLLSSVPRLARLPVATLLGWTGLAFTLSTGVAYAVVNLLPFDSYSIAWDPRQILNFALYYLVLTLPFMFAGLGIGAGLSGSQGRSHLVYAANLGGSALGVLLAPAVMWLAGVPGAILASAAGALLPTLARRSPVAGEGKPQALPAWARIFSAALLLGCLAALGVLAERNLSGQGVLGLALSPYKGLSHARRFPGATELYGRWDAVSRVDVVAGAGTRLLPGLSYTYGGEPPQQIGMAVDGDSLLPVPVEPPGTFEPAAYLPEAIAFELRPAARTLVLEPKGGLGVLQAAAGGAAEITAVTGDSLALDAVAATTGGGNPYGYNRVSTVVASPRVFLGRDGASYDLVLLPLTDAYRPIASGAYSLAETYMLTVEAFRAMLARLEPGGILVSSRWLQVPPSEDLRLVATLVEALENGGSGDSAASLVAYRGIQTLTALVKRGRWTAEELATIRRFVEARRYDLVWMPDIRPEEANRFNRMTVPEHYEAVSGLIAAVDRGSFYRKYPFAVEPTTDNRPFFFHFFRWGQTRAVLGSLGRTWQPFGGSGYLILFALLGLVLVLSAVLILLPLLLRVNRGPVRSSLRPGTVIGYFGLLGVAYLFVEIPLIQRWLLAFGHATYAFTAVVLILLGGSSMGSLAVRRVQAGRLGPRKTLLLLAGLAMLTAFGGGALVELTLGWPIAAQVATLGVTLIPLAVLMGLPFPLGLSALEQGAPGAVPWAWAVNGCASVVASVIAAIIGLSYGFTAVLLLGSLGYLLAAVLLPAASSVLRPSTGQS